MQSSFLVGISLTIVASVIRLVVSDVPNPNSCGRCGDSGLACVSETEFRVCNNGVPDADTLIECPVGTFCTNSATTCDLGAVPRCRPCNTCSADGRFACLDGTTVAFCYGGPNPSADTYKCPVNTVCNINAAAPNFCSQNDGTVSICSPPPRTVLTTTTTTTIVPTTTTQSPASWCTQKNTVGRFPVPSDTTCTSYYYCFVNGGSISGQRYTCTGTTVFNPVTQQCVLSTAYTCP
ncbi:hypothetical protein DMENIID0001_156690 [Sergentomyia squamirostris]